MITLKTLKINIVGGIVLAIIIWLMTLNEAIFFFSILIFLFLMILFHYLTTEFNWIFSILNFVICLIISGQIVNLLDRKFPTLEILNKEDFPTDYNIVFSAFSWILIKISIEIILKAVLPKKFIKITVIEEHINKKRQHIR